MSNQEQEQSQEPPKLSWAQRNPERVRELNRKWRAAHPEQTKAIARRSHQKNSVVRKASQAEYRRQNPDVNKEWVAAHREERREYNRKWQAANREKLNRYQREFRKRSPVHQLRANVSNLVARSLRVCGGKRGRSVVTILGYTIETLKAHLGDLFLPGMTWENYGSEWHVDHVRPVASFAFTSTSDPAFKECWALSNLRPLWATDNLTKSSTWNGRHHKKRSSP